MTEFDPLSDLPTIGGSSSRLRAGNAVGPGGRYVLEKEAGRGGMGVVWRARDTQLDDRPVALKFLPEVLAADEIALQDLRREARTMLELTYPGIVRLHTLEADEGLLFLVMEWLEGPTLRGALADCRQTERGLSAEDALWMLEEVAAAMDHAHEQGVLHRDIKPANLMLTKPAAAPLNQCDAHVKLTDFGIAYVASTSFTQLTGHSHTSGTLPYMAPELITGGRPSQASDLYALGATLYELIAGEPPFCRGDISLQIRKQEPPSLDSGDPALDAAIAAALAKDPAERPASATALLRAAQGKRLRRVARTYSSPKSTSDARPNRLLKVAVSVAAIAGISYAGWSMFGGGGDGIKQVTPSAEVAKEDFAKGDIEGENNIVAEVAKPIVELTEPVEGLVTNPSDYLSVKGRVTNAPSEGIYVQFLVDGSPLKPSVEENGHFELTIPLPKKDGLNYLQVLTADDDTVINQMQLLLDRKPPSLVGEPVLPPEGAIRSGEIFTVTLSFDEKVTLQNEDEKDLSTKLSKIHDLKLPALTTKEPNPTPISVSLVMFDEAGNQKSFDVIVQVYNQQEHEKAVEKTRPDSLDTWLGMIHEGRFEKMAEWVKGVEDDQLISEEVRPEMLRARPPVFSKTPTVLGDGPLRSGSKVKMSVSLDQPVSIFLDGVELGQLGEPGEVEFEAPKTDSGTPHQKEISLKAINENDEYAQVTVSVEVYNGDQYVRDWGKSLPELQEDWDPKEEADAEKKVDKWKEDVEKDPLLVDEEKEALLLKGTHALDQIQEAAERLNPLRAEGWEVKDPTQGLSGHAKKLNDPKTGITFILVEPGEFIMGSPGTEEGRSNDETEHLVKLTKPFYLGETEVTQAQWNKLMDSNPSRFKGDSLPVERVSWNDCREYLKKAGSGYRLPTEAEWEYACRADTTTPFSFGATISTDQVNYDGNYTYGSGRKGVYREKTSPVGVYREKTSPVGSFPPNAWDFYDMHGNVYEWCADWYGDYPSGPENNPPGPPSGEYRVLRGGSWFYVPWYCRSARRTWSLPDFRYDYLGFRVARTFP